MTDAYDVDYQKKAISISKELGYGDFTRTGVYCMVSGPAYESPAEIRLVQAVSNPSVILQFPFLFSQLYWKLILLGSQPPVMSLPSTNQIDPF